MKTQYDPAFYTRFAERSYRSAQQILPFVHRWVNPQTVVDVGCGVGTWLAAWRNLGVEDLLGVDGPYVDRELLMIPRERFRAHDLRLPLPELGSFDLVMSMEVAEHLPADAAATFVAGLTRLGPVILFSAAIPGQGGTDHVNEQWPEYWARLFATMGYEAIDCIRPKVWDDHSIEWWYAQNTLVYVRRDRLADYPELVASRRAGPLACVHPRLWTEPIALRQHLVELPGAVLRAIRRRLHVSSGER